MRNRKGRLVVLVRVARGIESVVEDPRCMLGDLARRDRGLGCGFRHLCHVFFGRRVCCITCRHVCTGPNGVATNTSKGAVSRVDLGQVRRLVASLGSRDCRPRPSGQVCVPGGGKGVHPLNMPTFGSGLLRRIIEVVLRTVCRERFRGASRNFQPLEDYRATLSSVRGAFSNIG